ncbi:MAG: hypothetical protein K9M75_03640 [Phycisphaerae bacterium]|nr:hypothetical protein [Phycisphaerae bacterium]
MDDAVFEERINELVKEIGTVPSPNKARLLDLAKKTGQSHRKLTKSVERLQESLDCLRVSVKYLVFDLEATRRENDGLKKALDAKGN